MMYCWPYTNSWNYTLSEIPASCKKICIFKILQLETWRGAIFGIFISQNNSRLAAPMSVRHFSGLMKFHSFRLCSGKRKHNVTNHPKVWMACSLLLRFCCHFLCSSLSQPYHPFSYLATVSLCTFSTEPLSASCAALQFFHTQTTLRAAGPCDLDLVWAAWLLGPLSPLSQEQPSKHKSRCLKVWTIPGFYGRNTGEL